MQGTGGDELGFALSHRPCPSAGAIHPIHLLVIDPQAGRWLRYDAVSHALDEVITQLEPSGVLAEMHSVLPATSATLLILAAEPGKTAAKYEAAESLVWRDAGVLLGFLAVAAEALGLNYCPLGVTGEPGWDGYSISLAWRGSERPLWGRRRTSGRSDTGAMVVSLGRTPFRFPPMS